MFILGIAFHDLRDSNVYGPMSIQWFAESEIFCNQAQNMSSVSLNTNVQEQGKNLQRFYFGVIVFSSNILSNFV